MNVKKNKDHGIQSYHFMTNMDGEKVEAVTNFLFLGSKITVDGDFSHKIRRCLLLGREAMPSQPKQCIKKQTHHFANKGPLQAKP